jgi:hypothetical protein
LRRKKLQEARSDGHYSSTGPAADGSATTASA